MRIEKCRRYGAKPIFIIVIDPVIEPFSLYIHVPFCVRKCNYCDFYSEPSDPAAIDGYIDGLLREWELAKKEYLLEGLPVETLYFGGGTPSILSFRQWERIIGKFVRELHFTPRYEWSIECNPDSFSPETASLWLDSGVTRISVGVQSLDDNELALMGRVHNARQAFDLLENPILSKFTSIGADLMYGTPGQTPGSFAGSLDAVLAASAVRHLSVYELTISPTTDFGRRSNLLPLPSDETTAAMTELLREKTAAASFERYEISNWCRPGHRCRHNEAYWRHKPYLGLGPAAHSFLAPQRFSNVNSLAEYCAALRAGTLPTGFSETIDTAALSREMIFLGLRTAEGISELDFRSMTGSDFSSPARREALQEFIKKGMLKYEPPFWRLTDQGMLFADGVARELM
jgi:oxygen-independent coproporphyrinogen III oxidase